MNPNDDASDSPNCLFTLDTGEPCRAPARRGDLFCRHHSPEARARRRQIAESAAETAESSSPQTAPGRAAQRSSDPDAIDPWALRAHWRIHHRLIPTFDPEQIDDAFNTILGALADREIGPRSAGRLFLAILDRRRELLRQAQQAAIHAMMDLARQVRAREQAHRPAFNGLKPNFEDLANYSASLVTPEIPRISVFKALEN